MILPFVSTTTFLSIPLTKGKFVIVDEEDYKDLIQYKWHVVIQKVYLGCFDKKEDAARIVDEKGIELFGDFTVLNLEVNKQ